jgi:hypothetical protein
MRSDFAVYECFEICNAPLYFSSSFNERLCRGIRNQAFRTPNREIISVNQVQFERLSCETPGAPKVRFHFSDSIFRPGPFVDSRVAKLAQRFKVLDFWSGSLVFSVTKPRGANPAHPTYYSLGFAGGVSSSLTFNTFKLGCDLCFRLRDVPGERGLSKRFEVFSRQAHVVITRKAPRFAA